MPSPPIMANAGALPIWRRLLPDRQFHLALLAGVVVLGTLALLQPPQPGWPTAWRLVSFVLLYPLLEEYLFRALLQETLATRLPARTGPLSHANLLTSVLFALAHLLYHPPLWAMAVFFPSLVFGHFRERYHHLLPHTLLHALYNGGYLLLWGGS